MTYKEFVKSAAAHYREGGWVAFYIFTEDAIRPFENGVAVESDLEAFDICMIFDQAENIRLQGGDVQEYLDNSIPSHQ